uniref:Uncharacterized protein n=1 Tax=Plectus sambesii TaxID=2011161 RepID=A0A914UVT2_9BILA
MASGGRRGLFKRPVDEDELPGRLVKAKPIAPHIARRLGDGGGFAGRDFVVGSSKTQSEFYGHQQVIDDEDGPSSATPVASDSGSRALTSDERNKLNARILKAELKGNKDLVKKLKKQLEDGVTESADDDGNKGGRRGAEEAAGGEVLLTKIDRRTGLIMPVRSGGEKQPAPSTGRKERVKAIDDKFSERKEVREMVEEERMTTAED